MATRILRKEPALPYVTLYLDDIQELCDVITAAYKEADQSSEVGFIFTVDDSVEYTTIPELEQHGGVAKKFGMTLDSKRGLLRLHIDYSVDFYASPLSSPNGLESKIKIHLNRIANDRKAALRTWFGNTASNLKLLPVFFIVPALLVTALSLASNGVLKGILYLLAACVVLFWVGGTYSIFSARNRVNLYFKRANERERSKRRKELIEKIVLLALGALFGTAGTLLVQHFKR